MFDGPAGALRVPSRSEHPLPGLELLTLPPVFTTGPGGDLTYTITGAPHYGDASTPVYDPTTDTYKITYRADEDAPTSAAIDDHFTVTASDANSGFHLHGLNSLFNPTTAHTDTATVNVDITVSGPTPPIDAAQLQHLVDSGLVEIAQNSNGTVRDIDGTFVLNRAAGLLGAPTGFASADNVTQFSLGVDEASTTHYFTLNQPIINPRVAKNLARKPAFELH